MKTYVWNDECSFKARATADNIDNLLSTIKEKISKLPGNEYPSLSQIWIKVFVYPQGTVPSAQDSEERK